MTYYLVSNIYALLSFSTFYFLISFFSSVRHPTDNILAVQHANYVDFSNEGESKWIQLKTQNQLEHNYQD